MLQQTIIDAVIAAAAAAEIPPAALLAVVEKESAGEPFELDGRTPRILFERHVFYRELAKRAPEKLQAAVKAGLAIKTRSRATQYKDQGRSAARLALLDRARSIDEECATRSCSWGLGQTMGFLAEELGFPSAVRMVDIMTAGGVAAQVDMMVKEITRKRLVDELQRQDWAGFARIYNGSAYEENKYDIKLEAAHRRWTRRLAAGGGTVTAPPSSRLSDYEVRAIQQQLVDLGYPDVGDIDGKWGSRTAGAVSAFRLHEGLPPGDYDEALRLALAEATRREPSPARAATTAQDLRAAGSETVRSADKGRGWAGVLAFLGLGGGVGQSGLLDQAQDAADQLRAVRPLVSGARDLLSMLGSVWWIVAIVIAVVIWRYYGDIITRRVADQVSGRHA